MQTITKETYKRRVKFYTRKLAEIEHFLEFVGPMQDPVNESQIIIHKYWQNQ